MSAEAAGASGAAFDAGIVTGPPAELADDHAPEQGPQDDEDEEGGDG